MGHYRNYNPQGFPNGSEDDPLRIFIRKHRKKLLIFLGVIVFLAIVAFVAFAVFLYEVLMSAGSEALRGASGSGTAQGVLAGAKNWISGILNNPNLTRWLGLILQFN